MKQLLIILVFFINNACIYSALKEDIQFQEMVETYKQTIRRQLRENQTTLRQLKKDAEEYKNNAQKESKKEIARSWLCRALSIEQVLQEIELEKKEHKKS